MEIGLNKIRWLFLKIQFLSKPKWKWLKNKANKKTIRNFRKICNIFCMLRLWIPYKQHLIIPVNDRPKQSRKKIKDNLFANRICVMCIYIGEQRVTWTQSSMKMQSEIMNLFSKLIDPTGSTGNTCKKIIISFPQSKGKTFRDLFTKSDPYHFDLDPDPDPDPDPR